MPVKTAILQAPVGGLGDGLLFSTLPELYAREGYKVLIDANKTRCRNNEVFDLLYMKNPFISGVHAGSDLPEGGERIGIVHEKSFFLAARRFRSPVECIEFLHGFEPMHDRPMIYYKPNIIDEWTNRVVIDPSSISQAFPPSVFDPFLARLQFDEEKFVILSRNAGNGGSGSCAGIPVITAADIYEYIDIVASCKYFVCTESGSQSLAAAVREEGTYAICTTMHMNSRLYVWPNVIYNATGQLSGDYLWNDQTAQDVGIAWQ